MPHIEFTRIANLFSYNEGTPILLTSGFFLFVFFMFLAIDQFLKEKRTIRVAYIALFSVYFCYKASGFFFLVLVATTLFNYLLAQWLAGRRRPCVRRILLAAGLVINFGTLAYFKYTNFFIETLNAVASSSFDVREIFLPVGISFYTFQVAAYLIDIYRKDIHPSRSLIDFLFFVSFFPKLLAGPIVRARDLLSQIENGVSVDDEKAGRGFALIIAGLIKKLIIADFIALNLVGRVFDNPGSYSGIENLMAAYGYTIQIYCDFSGYTDLALGIALLMGFELPQNFNAPYKAVNITDFWRRWHITLSSWFRDYLYIPLGGNRCSYSRQLFNIMAVMLICGLWHGASWTFVFWGGLHGAGLIIHRVYRRFIPPRKGKIGEILSILLTFHFVVFGWIFFRADSFETAFSMIARIATSLDISVLAAFIGNYTPVFICMLAGYMLHYRPDGLSAWWKKRLVHIPAPYTAALLAGAIWLVVQVRSADIQPFIYLQF